MRPIFTFTSVEEKKKNVELPSCEFGMAAIDHHMNVNINSLPQCPLASNTI